MQKLNEKIFPCLLSRGLVLAVAALIRLLRLQYFVPIYYSCSSLNNSYGCDLEIVPIFSRVFHTRGHLGLGPLLELMKATSSSSRKTFYNL